MSEGLVVEIRRGSADPRYLELTRGEPLQPLSVGLRADWRIEANGVLDVHAFLYFDGESLFVQSADASDAVRVNGRVVPGAWTAVEAPCTVAFGDARLVFCPLSQATAVAAPAARPAAVRPAAGRTHEQPRAAAPPPQPIDDDGGETIADVPLSALVPNAAARPAQNAPPRAAAVRPRAKRDLVAQQAEDDEATSSIPLPGGQPVPPPPAPAPQADLYPDDETTRALPLPAIAPSVALPRPAPPTPASPPSVMPIGGASPIAEPAPLAAHGAQGVAQGGPIAAPPPAAPVVEKPSPLATLKAQWREASIPKRAILVLLPFAFAAVVFGLDDDPRPAPTKKASPPSAVASASSSADEPVAAKADEPAPKPTATAEDLDDPPPAKTVAKVENPSKPPKTDKPPPAEKSDKGGKTLERAAVDAVAAGSWLHAAGLYQQLADEHPEVPAYREAARILRAKSKK